MVETVPPADEEDEDHDDQGSDGAADYRGEGDLRGGGRPGKLDEGSGIGIGGCGAGGVSIA